MPCGASSVGDKKGEFPLALSRLAGKTAAAAYVKRNRIDGDSGVGLEYSHKYTKKHMPALAGDYDLAVSFLTPHYFVSEKVNAKKKIAWIHTDYKKLAVDRASEEKMWGAYDYIASISDECTKSFLSVFPSLSSKIVRIDNILMPELIKEQTKQDVSSEMPRDGSVRLLSAGRFTYAKNFDSVPDICRRMTESGLNVRWYLIGFGGDEEKIKEQISLCGMQERVIILGKKENPYPYMASCDIYVQPSRYEGNCVSVREAQALGKAVVITAYPTSAGQLENGFDGSVIPLENERAAEALGKIIRDGALRERLEKNTAAKNYSNSSEIEKLYRLLK